MAPKRAAQDARNAGAQKKPKLNPMLGAISDAIDIAELPESCKLMLKAIIPDSFGVASDKRHAIQSRAVEAIGKVMDDIKLNMQSAIESESANVEGAEAQKAALSRKVDEAKERLAAISEDVAAKKVLSTDASRDVIEKRNAHTEAKKEQQKGDTAIAKAKSEKEGFEAAIKEQLEPLFSGDIDGAQATAHYKALRPFIAKLTVEESLVSPLPGICMKASKDRGSFDLMVLQQVDKTMRDHFAQIEKTIAEEAPASEARAAAVSAAQEAEDIATKAQHQAVTVWNAAQGSQKEAEAVVNAAEVELLQYEPEYKKCTAARDEKLETLKAFETWNYECYQVCRDKVTQTAEGGA